MGRKGMLTSYLGMLELARKDVEMAIHELLAMKEAYHKDKEAGRDCQTIRAKEEGLRSWGQYEVSLVTKMKAEVMVMSKINPALTLEVKHAERKVEPSMNWLVQVVCAEHQVSLPSS